MPPKAPPAADVPDGIKRWALQLGQRLPGQAAVPGMHRVFVDDDTVDHHRMRVQVHTVDGDVAQVHLAFADGCDDVCAERWQDRLTSWFAAVDVEVQPTVAGSTVVIDEVYDGLQLRFVHYPRNPSLDELELRCQPLWQKGVRGSSQLLPPSERAPSGEVRCRTSLAW